MLVVVFSSVTQVTLFNYDLDPAGIHLFWLPFWVIFCWLFGIWLLSVGWNPARKWLGAPPLLD